MHISISGTQSVGKTTLLNELKNHPEFKDYKFVEEATRWILPLGLPINEESAALSQTLIMSRHLFNIYKFTDNDNVVADRHPLDCLVYSTRLYKTGKISENDLKEFSNVVFNVLRSHSFDVIAYIPIEFDLVDDGVRSTDVQFRNEIDEYFKGILDAFHETFPEYYERSVVTLTGTVEERIEKLIKFKNNMVPKVAINAAPEPIVQLTDKKVRKPRTKKNVKKK